MSKDNTSRESSVKVCEGLTLLQALYLGTPDRGRAQQGCATSPEGLKRCQEPSMQFTATFKQGG